MRPTRRLKRRRDASVIGMVGAAVMAGQSASMLVGGILALLALRLATGGDLGGATNLAGTALIFVGFTLLFDIIGVGLLSGAFYLHSRAREPEADRALETRRRALTALGFFAAILLIIWILVTVAWRVALAALVSFYPSPFGGTLEGVGAEELRRAASVMLGLWVAAAFLLFLGAFFGTRYLQRSRGVPPTLPRVLWPLETLLHFSAALAILAIAPGLLARALIELRTLRLVETLGVLDLIIVPVLGILAYVFLFWEFYRLFGETRTLALPPTPLAANPPGEA